MSPSRWHHPGRVQEGEQADQLSAVSEPACPVIGPPRVFRTADLETRKQLGAIVQHFGPRIPGLTHGLTHLFPSAEVLAAGDLTDLDLQPATVKNLAALAAGVTSGETVLDHAVRRTDLITTLTSTTRIQPATAHQIALRLGHREPGRDKLADQGHGSAAPAA